MWYHLFASFSDIGASAPVLSRRYCVMNTTRMARMP